MFNGLEHISIENFKSIKHLPIINLNRINLFIGRPNVGKSNIMEALSLFSVPYLWENTSKKLSNLVRLETEIKLFYNGNIEKDVVITTNQGKCKLGYNPKDGLKAEVDFFRNSFLYKIDDKLNVKGSSRNEYFEPPIKKYVFKPDIKYKRCHSKYLVPPFGFNLLALSRIMLI